MFSRMIILTSDKVIVTLHLHRLNEKTVFWKHMSGKYFPKGISEKDFRK